MKKTVIILMTMMVSFAISVKAQSLGDIVKSAASSAASAAASKATGNSSAGNAVSDIISGLLGNKTVNANSLVGTWKYNQPAIVFESSNVLSSVSGKAVSSQVQKYLQSGLNQIGFKKGSATLALKKDGTGTITVKGKAFPLKWSVSGSNLNITLSNALANGQKAFTINVKLSGNNLQLAMKADKILALLKSVCSNAGSASSYLTTIDTLMKKVDGMYIGLQFTK